MRDLNETRLTYAPYVPSYVPCSSSGTYEKTLKNNILHDCMYRMYLIKKSIRKSKTYNMFLRVLVYIYIQQTRCIPYIQSAKRLFPITNWYVLRFFKVHTACTPRTYGTRNALNSFNFEKIEGCIRYV